MGFFDDLVVTEEPGGSRDPGAERSVLARLRPPGADEGRFAPPVDRFVPVLVPQPELLGATPEIRVMLTGWSVWPRSVTLHLAVFRRTRRHGQEVRSQSGLRVGLLLPGGRRVTSLDGTVLRQVPISGPAGPDGVPVQEQAIGLIPLDPGLPPSGSLFRTRVDLYLPELPPPGEARLVVEWPDEELAETRTPVDLTPLLAESRRVVEVWPESEWEPEPEHLSGRPRLVAIAAMGGPAAFLAPPLSRSQVERLRREEEARQRYVPRGDWERMGFRDWADAALVGARLEGGAPPGAVAGPFGATPLHLAAEWGGAEAVRLLLRSGGAETEAADERGQTPLWYAVRSMDEARIRILIDAGADVWTPQAGPWSPGRLLLTTPLAPLVADLPGAVPLSAEESEALGAADRLIAAFGEEPLWTEGLGVAFVRGLGEEEVIRRLGADPARCPLTEHGQEPFDPQDFDASLGYVGVRGVPGTPGGCVVAQDGYLPNDTRLLRAISAGTTAYGVYFNPKGGTFGALARDGEIVAREEIGFMPHASDPEAHWYFRFWQHRSGHFHGAALLAYACAAAGLVTDDGRAAVDLRLPRRWAPLPASWR